MLRLPRNLVTVLRSVQSNSLALRNQNSYSTTTSPNKEPFFFNLFEYFKNAAYNPFQMDTNEQSYSYATFLTRKEWHQTLRNLNATKGQQAAKEYLKQGIELGKANHYHCNWGMKELCETSEEVRDLITQMQLKNIHIKDSTLRCLIYQLLVEDKREEAQDVINTDYKKYGVTLKKGTLEIMYTANADKLATMGFVTGMKRMLNEYGKETTLEYLIQLISNGQANTIHCNWGMKELCDTSKEARDLTYLMAQHNIPVNVITLNTFRRQLLLEGNQEEAQVVLDGAFKKYGVDLNDKKIANEHASMETMAENARTATTIRHTNRMKKMLDLNGKESCLQYLMHLISNGQADTIHCSWGMKMLCDTSSEMRGLINQMHEHDVVVDVVALNILIRQCLVEDNQKDAQDVLENDFDTYELIPNAITMKTMDSAEKLASTGHMIAMKKMFNVSGLKLTKKYLNQLIQAQKANTTHCNWGMKQLCVTSNDMNGLMYLMNDTNISVNETTLNVLIHQYLIEDNKKEATAVFDIGFSTYGLVPNEITLKMLETTVRAKGVKLKNKRLQPKSKKELTFSHVGNFTEYKKWIKDNRDSRGVPRVAMATEPEIAK